MSANHHLEYTNVQITNSDRPVRSLRRWGAFATRPARNQRADYHQMRIAARVHRYGNLITRCCGRYEACSACRPLVSRLPHAGQGPQLRARRDDRSRQAIAQASASASTGSPTKLLERKHAIRLDRIDRIDPSKTAMIVVDMQNDFVADGAKLRSAQAAAMVPTLAQTRRFCHEKVIRVVYTAHVHRRDGCDMGLYDDSIRRLPTAPAWST